MSRSSAGDVNGSIVHGSLSFAAASYSVTELAQSITFYFQISPYIFVWQPCRFRSFDRLHATERFQSLREHQTSQPPLDLIICFDLSYYLGIGRGEIRFFSRLVSDLQLIWLDGDCSPKNISVLILQDNLPVLSLIRCLSVSFNFFCSGGC